MKDLCFLAFRSFAKQGSYKQVFGKSRAPIIQTERKLTQGITDEVDRVGNGRRLAFLERSKAVAGPGRRGGVSPAWAAVASGVQQLGGGKAEKEREREVEFPREADP